jgi:hypothetical protein
MSDKRRMVGILVAVSVLSFPAGGAGKDESTGSVLVTLWRNPTDIASRNLFFGPGGKKHQPHSTFTFLKEDLDGTNPKFVVRDDDGVKWKIKLGEEARPETVASRLAWAVGYFANEDYFLPDLRVRKMPSRLHRGQNLVASNGSMHDARLKRYLPGEKKIGNWQWRHDPFTGTRVLNGLRVIMALMNNWDLKDINNAVYEEKENAGPESPKHTYLVSDLGASFGTTGRSWTRAKGKGNLNAYRHSKFISKVTADYVDFATPSRPALVHLSNPAEFISRLRLRGIGKRIPRADAKWVGQLLARLSPAQIRDAFRAAGYSPQEVDGFAKVVEQRIAELSDL